MSPRSARSARRPRPSTASEERPPTPPPPPGIPLGATGRLHPPLGLGLAAQGRWTREDEARTKATIGRALERRVEWFDTAEAYGGGRSERILGDALARLRTPPAPPFLTTKVLPANLRAGPLRAAALASLQRLGVPQVSVLLVHGPNPKIPIAETMGALEALWKEEKIGALGVSNFSVTQLEEARRALAETDVVVHQILYNLFEREEAEEVLEYCQRARIVVEAYSPLSRGLLAGRFLEGKPPPRADPRHGRAVFAAAQFPELQKRAQALRRLAEAAKIPLLSIPLHWLAGKGTAPVFGASRPEQVDAVLEAWRRPPSHDLLNRADRIALGHGD